MKVHRTIIHLKGKNGNAIFLESCFMQINNTCTKFCNNKVIQLCSDLAEAISVNNGLPLCATLLM